MTRVEKVVQKLHSELTSKNILEVACGCGEFSIAASKLAKTVHAIDLDAARLFPEAKSIPNLHVHLMDATDMTFADQSFDAIIMYNAIGHLAGVVEDVLSECLRVLKRGGSLYIISSFRMDKRYIAVSLIPCLEGKHICFELNTDEIFVYIKVTHE